MKPHLFIALLCVLTLLIPATGIPAAAGITTVTTTRVSVTALGTEGNSWSSKPIISADGHYVVFESWADNLVVGDTNSAGDIFVYDRQTGTPSRVSLTATGGQANSTSGGWGRSAISADGRYVAFISAATNLVSGDTNECADIFIRDRTANTTTRVSASSAGVQANGDSDYPALSGNGRYVAFWSAANNLVAGDTNDALDIFVHDLTTHQTTRIAIGGAGGVEYGGRLDLSNDGRYVAFASHVDTLVPNDNNAVPDVFLFDRNTSQFSRVSLTSAGGEADSVSLNPALSPDARYVAFTSSATNLAAGDTNDEADVFVRDRQTGQTTRVSVSSSGSQTGQYETSDFAAISADGRYVAFASTGSNLVSGDTNDLPDIFVRDRQTNQTTRVSVTSGGAQGGGESNNASISSDGRFVAFDSYAADLVPDDENAVTDAFVHDRGGAAGVTYTVSGRVRDGGGTAIADVTVSAGVGGSAVTDASGNYTIAGLPAGAYTLHATKSDCAFAPGTRAVTLPPNATGQDFTGTCVTTPPPGCDVGTSLVSIDAQGHEGNGESGKPAISADGRYVVFESWADNLVTGDTNNMGDLFVFDRQTRQPSRVSVRSDGGQASTSVGGWGKPALSADGRIVAFASDDGDLVDGDTNGQRDIFVHNRVTGQTVLVSRASGGAQGNGAADCPAVSGNGRYVAFWSESDNLVPGDTNDALDLFIHDLQTGQLERIALDGAGGASYGGFIDLSFDGRLVAFSAQGHVQRVQADDNPYPDIYVYDRQTGQFSLVSVGMGGAAGDGNSTSPAMSSDGRYVVFGSDAPNLVSGDTNALSDIFLRDRQAGQTVRVSVSSAGSQGNGDSGFGDSAAVSADGRIVAFASSATNLVSGDTNGDSDVFTRDRQASQTARMSLAPNGAQFDTGSAWLSISDDGRAVAFEVGSQIYVRGWCPAGASRDFYLPLMLKRR
ncbi:MAG: carboxypeptidase regulatory-like domain-containing protein [Chloroflexi bacterium]|nr:carboxypeptidase regulatory-like domain-containing protein [Chloroflexota bacterium]